MLEKEILINYICLKTIEKVKDKAVRSGRGGEGDIQNEEEPN